MLSSGPPLSSGDLRKQQPPWEQQWSPSSPQLPLPEARGGRPEDPEGFHGVSPEELHLPSLFLAWKAPGLPFTGGDGKPALHQLCRGHETISMAACSEAIHRLALKGGGG